MQFIMQLGPDIAAITAREQLYGLLNGPLKEKIGFQHTTIFVSNNNGEEMADFLNDYDHSTGPGIDTGSETHRFPLVQGKSVIGSWMVLFKEGSAPGDEQISLCRMISIQLTFAIIAIKTKEEIDCRNKEREIIHSLNIDFATLREKKDLLRIIHYKLKNLFDFSHHWVATVNEDDLTMSTFMQDTESRTKFHPKYKQVTSAKYPIADQVFNKVILAGEPQVFDLERLIAQKIIPEYLQINYESGIRKVIMQSLEIAGRFIGVWAICLSEQHIVKDTCINLVRDLASQFSIAIGNILANERILKRETEINTYKQQLEEEKIYLKEEIETAQNYSDIIGESPSIKRTFKLVSQVAPSGSTVLILGETGTGKELIARAIHNDSPRKDKLMVKVNCAALPPNLIESELFGHERGSFTGATEQRLGKFELANNSTLFLDEIGEMPPDLQVKLLRVLQEKEIERVGGRKTIKVDVRIVAATNRDLEKEVAEGRFRSDLYYRLNIFPISLPPLRDRREDIPLLAAYFIERFAKKAGRHITTFSNRAMQEMMQYNWPGNIRELEHLIERSVLLSSGDTIRHIHLPLNKPITQTTGPEELTLKTIDENEREHILKTLKFCGGKMSGENGAAQILGVPPGTLYSKMKRLGIKREYAAHHGTPWDPMKEFQARRSMHR